MDITQVQRTAVCTPIVQEYKMAKLIIHHVFSFTFTQTQTHTTAAPASFLSSSNTTSQPHTQETVISILIILGVKTTYTCPGFCI